MWQTWLAVLLALGSALSQAFGAVMRHRTAADAVGAGPAVSALRSPMWWAGTGVSGLGFVLQGAALAFGSLLLVQPVTVLSLMFALPIGARFMHRQVTRAEWFWGSVLTVCIVVIVVLGRPVGGETLPPWWQWLIAVALGVAAMTALLTIARGLLRKDRALLTGVAGGIAFAYVALFTKGVVDRWVLHGWSGVVLNGEFYGLLAAGAIALAVQQSSFTKGAVHQTVPASTVTTPVVAIALGLGLLGERFAEGPVSLAGLGVAVAVMMVATVQLSRAEVPG